MAIVNVGFPWQQHRKLKDSLQEKKTKTSKPVITSIRADKKHYFLHSDTSMSSLHEHLALSLQYLNQSAWQNGSSGGLIDALIQSLSSAAVWSLLKANTARESSMGCLSNKRVEPD